MMKHLGLRIGRLLLRIYHGFWVKAGESLAMAGFGLIARCGSLDEWLRELNRYSAQFGVQVVTQDEAVHSLLALGVKDDALKH